LQLLFIVPAGDEIDVRTPLHGLAKRTPAPMAGNAGAIHRAIHRQREYRAAGKGERRHFQRSSSEPGDG